MAQPGLGSAEPTPIGSPHATPAAAHPCLLRHLPAPGVPGDCGEQGQLSVPMTPHSHSQVTGSLSSSIPA